MNWFPQSFQYADISTTARMINWLLTHERLFQIFSLPFSLSSDWKILFFESILQTISFHYPVEWREGHTDVARNFGWVWLSSEKRHLSCISCWDGSSRVLCFTEVVSALQDSSAENIMENEKHTSTIKRSFQQEQIFPLWEGSIWPFLVSEVASARGQRTFRIGIHLRTRFKQCLRTIFTQVHQGSVEEACTRTDETSVQTGNTTDKGRTPSFKPRLLTGKLIEAWTRFSLSIEWEKWKSLTQLQCEWIIERQSSGCMNMRGIDLW